MNGITNGDGWYDIPLSRSSALHIGILQNGITNGDGYILNDMICRLAYLRHRYYISVFYKTVFMNGITNGDTSILAVNGITYRYCTG